MRRTKEQIWRSIQGEVEKLHDKLQWGDDISKDEAEHFAFYLKLYKRMKILPMRKTLDC